MNTIYVPCAVCGKYSVDCNCGLFGSKENESTENNHERKELYELTGIRDERLHIQPYADMIDKLTYAQKADFAKRALELERDVVSYKQAFEEVSRSRNEWIAEVQSIRAQKVQVSMQLEEAIKLLQTWIHDHAPLNESINFVQAYWNEHNIFPYEP